MALLPGNAPQAAVPIPTRAKPANAAPRRGLPFKWFLLGGILFALFFAVLLAVGLFAGVNKLKDYGYDPELARKYPALMGFLIVIKSSGTIEDLQIDKEHGTATFKEKRSGRKIRVSEIRGTLKREYLDSDAPPEIIGPGRIPPPPKPKLKLKPPAEKPEGF